METGIVVYVGIREEAMAWSGHRVPARVLEYTPEKQFPDGGTVKPGIKLILLEDYVERNPYNGEIREGVIAARAEKIYTALPRLKGHSIEDLFTKGELECNFLPEDKKARNPFLVGILRLTE